MRQLAIPTNSDKFLRQPKRSDVSLVEMNVGLMITGLVMPCTRNFDCNNTYNTTIMYTVIADYKTNFSVGKIEDNGESYEVQIKRLFSDFFKSFFGVGGDYNKRSNAVYNSRLLTIPFSPLTMYLIFP